MVKSWVETSLRVKQLPAFCVAQAAFGIVAAEADARPLWSKIRSDNLRILFLKASIL
jgi:hypothetical protein